MFQHALAMSVNDEIQLQQRVKKTSSLGCQPSSADAAPSTIFRCTSKKKKKKGNLIFVLLKQKILCL